MSTTTRAAVLRRSTDSEPFADSAPLSIEEVTLARPGPGEALVLIVAAGFADALVTSRSVPIDDLDLALDRLHAGAEVRQIITP